MLQVRPHDPQRQERRPYASWLGQDHEPLGSTPNVWYFSSSDRPLSTCPMAALMIFSARSAEQKSLILMDRTADAMTSSLIIGSAPARNVPSTSQAAATCSMGGSFPSER